MIHYFLYFTFLRTLFSTSRRENCILLDTTWSIFSSIIGHPKLFCFQIPKLLKMTTQVDQVKSKHACKIFTDLEIGIHLNFLGLTPRQKCKVSLNKWNRGCKIWYFNFRNPNFKVQKSSGIKTFGCFTQSDFISLRILNSSLTVDTINKNNSSRFLDHSMSQHSQ